MKKTTIYLPDTLKQRLEARARGEQRSEADVIRTAVASYVGAGDVKPQLPLFSAPPIEDFDEALRGFGEG
jgi:Ribbon-helix-helix protein, copG family